MKKALITGIWGQDGSFLCEQLFSQGYQVYGIAKKNLSPISIRIQQELLEKGICPEVIDIDLYNYEEVKQILADILPNEVYHMAAYHVSSEGSGNGLDIRKQELYNKNVLATANILESCYTVSPNTHVLTAGSCLMYDASKTSMQTESTPFSSNSLYGLAKIAENSLVNYYRSNGLFACTAILYNHESHRRSSNFVTKKIVENMIKLKRKEIPFFSLGDLNTQRDWGYAADYTSGMQLMLRSTSAKDYLLATKELHSIQEFIKICAEYLGLDDYESFIKFNNTTISRKIYGIMCGDCSKIEHELGWKRTKTFQELVYEMMDYELKK